MKKKKTTVTKDPLFYDEFDVSLHDATLQDSDNGAAQKPVIVTINATHAGYVNRNYYYYSPEGMAKAVDSWLKPFPKPLLLNHDQSVDPMGRVVDARYIGDSQSGFIQLKVKVTDPEAIAKIKDGRYLTVSTGGTPVDSVTCSICKANLLESDEFCGHMRGQVYETEDGVKEVCYWIIGQMNYKEISVVNVPADQSKNHAAMIVNWQFSDAEGDVPVNQDAVEETHYGVMLIDGVEIYDAPEIGDADLDKLAFLIDNDVDVLLMPPLWDSIEAKDTRERLSLYLQKGGLIKGDISDADVWVPTEDDLALLDWLAEQLDKAPLPEDELFDKPMKEETKKKLSKKEPKKFCGPMDPRKGRRSFPVTSCSQARTAMRLLPKYKGPGDKDRIAACIRRRAKEMGCPFSDALMTTYDILDLLESFVKR